MTKIDWGYLFGMALQTVPEPRKVARDVMAFPAPRGVLWQILALILVSMTFLAVLSTVVFPVDPGEVGAMLGEDELTPVFADPLLTGLVQAVTAVGMVAAIFWIGRALGGTGSFDDALLTVIWLHFVLLLLQIGILVLGLFAPGLGLLLTLLSFVMTFWLLSHFIAEMHGFRSAGAVFAGIMMVLLVLAVALSLAMALTGFGMAVNPGQGGA